MSDTSALFHSEPGTCGWIEDWHNVEVRQVDGELRPDGVCGEAATHKMVSNRAHGGTFWVCAEHVSDYEPTGDHAYCVASLTVVA